MPALQRLYRSADRLLKHHDALESYLFGAAQALFSFAETITLYYLTHTYFEGVAAGIDKAQRGRSKEKRNDCPLVTLGWVIDHGLPFPVTVKIHPAGAVPAAMSSKPVDCAPSASGIDAAMPAKNPARYFINRP